jgi:hypothetical protein
MTNKELLNIIFTHPYIEKKSWIFDADIDWNTVDIRIDDDNDNYIVWYNGTWNKGTWKKGTWITGKIYNHKTGEYQESTLPPNQCKWSYSYEG